MDRELAPELVTKSRRKTWLIGTVVVTGLAASVFWFRGLLETSVNAAEIRVVTAETGPVENTLNATGEIIPAYEQIITSPIRASIRRVLLTPGTRVRSGQAILELDKSLSLIELDKLKDQLALKRNGIDQLRMKLNKGLFDAEVADQIKSLNINKLKAELEDARRLQKVGGRTQEDVTRAENALKIALLEKKQLENDLGYNRQSMGASLRESQLQADIEGRNLKELEYKLRQADILTDREGVLTWVNENIGTAVNEGDMLAKLADLGSFRVDGSASDVYADRVKPGLPVIVKLNEQSLRGTISQVKPAVKNGIVQFAVQLDDNRHTSLRPNMKVEIFIVTERSPRAIRVANGPAFKGPRRQSLFVLKDAHTAERREVEVGLSNFDYVELKSGIQAGEKVIVTDLSKYEHLQTITVNNK